MSSSRRSSAPPVVLLFGSEATLRDEALADLRERALGSGPRDFNEDRLDLAAGTDPRAVLTACRTLPAMAPQRLVVVRGLDHKRAETFVETLLPEYLEAPAETSCLVLVAEKVDRRLRWVKRVAKLGQVLECSAPKRAPEQREWIERRIRGLGKRPERGCAAALLDLVGPDLDRLAFEIEKLCLYAGEAEQVGVDDVHEVTAALRMPALWELTDAIGGRRQAEALRVLARLGRQGVDPLPTLAALANHFRRLLRVHECRPLTRDAVARALSMHPFAAGKLIDQTEIFDPARLRRCLDAVRRTDEVLKGAAPLARPLAIERLVMSVCA